MASPSLMMTAAGERSFAFFCLHPSSRPSPQSIKRRPLSLSSVSRFPFSQILFVSDQVRCCRPISSFSKIRSSVGPIKENGGSMEDSVASTSSSSDVEADHGVRSPRRNLLVQFTCDSCGVRTQRIINRVAFDRGTVFLQCAGCAVYHKLVDNLNLVVEYDLRDE